MSDQPIDYEKQALGSTIMALTQEGINLRASILALQAEHGRLTAEAEERRLAEAANARLPPPQPAAKLVKS